MKKWLAMLVTMLLLAQMTASAETVHVEKDLTGIIVSVHVNADVEDIPVGTSLALYQTDYVKLDAKEWASMFQVQENAVQVNGGEVCIDADVFAKYFPKEVRLGIQYTDNEHYFDFKYAKNQQAEGLKTTPEQAVELAQAWVNRAEAELGWDGYVLSECYTMPKMKEYQLGACYLVEFKRMLGNYPVAHDELPIESPLGYGIVGDCIRVEIDDDGIANVDGYCRSFEQTTTETIQISLEQAIDILEENLDYVPYYLNQSEFDITQIELCYRLVRTLPYSDANVEAQMEARPAWRFASGVNRWEQGVFVMFVDAVTGEILE